MFLEKKGFRPDEEKAAERRGEKRSDIGVDGYGNRGGLDVVFGQVLEDLLSADIIPGKSFARSIGLGAGVYTLYGHWWRREEGTFFCWWFR